MSGELSPEVVARYRAEFPVLAKQIYVNHAGVSPTSLRTARAIRGWVDGLVEDGLRDENAWEEHSERVRARAAAMIGAKPGEVAFVRSTSHGLGLVAEGLDYAPGDEIAVATSIEYPSNVYPWLHLRDRGVVVKEIVPTAPDGGVRAEDVARALTPRTRLVAVSSVQYASGHATPLREIGRALADASAARGREILFCVDAIQSVGCVKVDVKACGIHFLSADSHKWMLGINGIGFFFVDERVVKDVRPVLVGWKSTTDAWNFNRAHFDLRADAHKFEEGSPSYVGIYALGAALELLDEVGIDAVEARIRGLLGSLDPRLRAAGCSVGPSPDHRAGILTFVPGEGAGAVNHATVEALYAHLAANRVSLSLRRGRLRISPHFYTLEDELHAVVDLVRGFRAKA